MNLTWGIKFYHTHGKIESALFFDYAQFLRRYTFKINIYLPNDLFSIFNIVIISI